jgi:hypothetical protein
MIVSQDESGIYGFLLSARFSRGSGGGGGGGYGRTKLSKGQESQTKAKGLSGCHPSGQQPRQPDRGQRAKIKNYTYDNLLKNTELKAALIGSARRAKRQPSKECTTIEKGKMLTLCSKLEVAEGEDVKVDEGVDG